MIGNEEDFTASLGFEVEGADEHLTHIETDAFKKMIDKAVAEYPNFKVAATTLREGDHRHKERLERDLLHGRTSSTRAGSTPTSRSSTGSAAATASPAA